MSTVDSRFRRAVCGLSAAFALAGCSETFGSGDESLAAGAAPRIAAQSEVSAPDSDYKIAPLDVLQVSVFEVQELDGVHQVSATGRISMPLIGEVPAQGRTVKQLQNDIAARLGADYIRNPDVQVLVKEYTSQRFTVEGAVMSAGIYSMSGRTTLLQAIAMAKGLSRIADSEVAIFRKSSTGERTVARYDLKAIRTGEREDPIIAAGDVVVVGESAIRSAWADVKDVFGVGVQGAGLAIRLVP
jgi:polysaccharide export outer membrane protein